MRVLRLLVAVPLLLARYADGAVVTSVFGGRVPCAVDGGVQFCAGSVGARVETWDGIPLDANVTLPPADMDGPFPLVVELHGWSFGKTDTPFVERALAGYVVLSYSARGFHASCGSPASRAPDPLLAEPGVCATRGWVHLADARYEARDTQYLAGLLVDEGLVLPDRVGVTGVSYGGGQSLILAALKDRLMLPDGSLVPWRSPGGTDMRIAAAAPVIPWSDLAYALTPNGRTLDTRPRNPYGQRGGVLKQSWVDLLFTVGGLTGFYAPPGADPDADNVSWKARLDQGEPYDTDPLLRHALAEVAAHHSAYAIDDTVAPAPLFIYSAWTDDLFPVDEALRFYLKAKSRHPEAEIALQFADGFGHPRANVFSTDTSRFQTRIEALFARHLKGVGDPLPPLETYTQACNGAVEQGPFAAADWAAIHPGEVRFLGAGGKQFDSAGGSETNAKAVDPLMGPSCRTVPTADDPGAATYRLPPATGAGYTLMGSPTVSALLAVSGSFPEVAARLWDVAPDETQTLVSHALYRPGVDEAATQVFQLHPNGWHFAAGHVPKLELLGQSAPYGRASNGTFTVSVRELVLTLPVVEVPDGTTITVPGPPVLPPPDPPVCAPVPRTGCLAPVAARAARLQLRSPRKARARCLAWEWSKGAATTIDDLGNPLETSGYALCVYDGTPRLVMSATAPPASRCGKTPCWHRTRKGFRYLDRQGTPDGLARLDLRAGGAGAARIVVGGRGPNLALPSLPLSAIPVEVQLENSEGRCWRASFSAAQTSRARLSVRSD